MRPTVGPTGPPTDAPTAAPTLRYLKVGDQLYFFNFSYALEPTQSPTIAPTTHAQELTAFTDQLGDLLDSITEAPTPEPTAPPTPVKVPLFPESDKSLVADATSGPAAEARQIAEAAKLRLMSRKIAMEAGRAEQIRDGNQAGSGGATIQDNGKTQHFFNVLEGVLNKQSKPAPAFQLVDPDSGKKLGNFARGRGVFDPKPPKPPTPSPDFKFKLSKEFGLTKD